MLIANDRPLSNYSSSMHISCPTCGFHEVYHEPLARCPKCGEDILEIHYDLASLQKAGWGDLISQRKRGLWRFRELLPLKNYNNIVSLGEGDSPLLHMQNLGAMLGLKYLYFKDERQSPTHSFKDRQATVAISVMKEQGISEAVVASTGNVAIAYSAYAARAGIKIWAFLPSLAPNEKLREVAVYGTEVIKVTGSYDQTKTMAASFAERKGIYYDRGIKSTAAMESMKTMAFEIAEELGWHSPDWFIQGVSGGMGPIGAIKGFEELYAMGLVDKVPSLGIIQSSGCDPMVQAFNNGMSVAVPIENPQTIIATLATGNPGRAYQVLWDIMQKHGGAASSASDEEAFETTRLLARTEGISVEPATAVAFAGLVKLVREGKIKSHEVVVFNCTGHTFPVETHILGDQWEKRVDLSKVKVSPVPETRLLTALEQVGNKARRVVVIEDNIDSARLIERILHSTGHEVRIAADGIIGLALVREIMPDLIITDLMMPRLDGFQVIQALKEDEALRHIPVIVLTAKELTVKEKNQLNGQVDTLLRKGSFMSEDLVEHIMDALGG